MKILQVVLTAFLSATALFIIAKMIGHKQMSQLDFFDYITGITIGSIAAELATELEQPLYPLIAMIVYGCITIILAFLTAKFPKTRKYINGSPTIIMSNGKIYRKNMKKAKLELSEFMVLCRQEGYFDLGEIEAAIFEYNGKLTVLPKSTKRPVTPTDLNILPPQNTLYTEIIMDGRILNENLLRLGLDEKWLYNELTSRGFKTTKQIYLALCDNNFRLTLYENC